MSDSRKPAQEESDGGTQLQRIGSATIDDDTTSLVHETTPAVDTAPTTIAVSQYGGMEDFYSTIYNVLSNVELYSSFPHQAIESSSTVPNVPKPQKLETGESSIGKKNKSTAPKISHSDDENQRRDSKRSGRDNQRRRSHSADLHNMSERMLREQIRIKMQGLQALIPNCNTRDKASVLDDAIKYIKALQNQVLMMSTGAGAMRYALQAGYQGLQLPQFASQFMPMRPGIGMGMGMGMYGMSSSTAFPMMPFPFASPCQSTLAASGMAIVGPIPQMQFPLNPFHSLSSADSTLTVAPTSFTGIASTFVCITNSETSSQSVPRTADLCQAPLMSQVSIIIRSSPSVLPSQIITPASSSSNSVVAEIPHVPEDDNNICPSQR